MTQDAAFGKLFIAWAGRRGGRAQNKAVISTDVFIPAGVRERFSGKTMESIIPPLRSESPYFCQYFVNGVISR
jgi:hypothetical protein